MTGNANLLIKYRDADVAELYAGYRPNLSGDAGFDLYCPEDVKFGPRETKIVPLGIVTAMTRDDSQSEAYKMYVDRSLWCIWFALLGVVLLLDRVLGLAIIACALGVAGLRFWMSMLHGDYPGELVRPDVFISYRIYPRSSISKTPLRLANSVGVVDSGYRGEIMAALDNISDSEYTIARGTRIVQLVCDTGNITSVSPVELFDKTERGARGFGSTN